MKRAIVIGAVLVLGGWCLAADWPNWRGPENNCHLPAGEAVPKTLPTEPIVLWRVRIGTGLASPIVIAGKVVYLDDQRGKEVVHAVEVDTGKEHWKAELDDVHKDHQPPPGPRCAPVGDGERVYVQSCRGEFRCLNLLDGKTVWGVNFVKDFDAVYIGEKGSATGASRHGYSGSPLIDGDRILVGVGGTKGASVVCFDKKDGRVIWKSQNDIPAYAGPVIATIAGLRQVISFQAEALIGLDVADGKPLWRVPVKTAFGRHVTTPLVRGDIVIVSSHQAGLMGVRVTKTGESFEAVKAWVAKGSAINFCHPVLVGDYLYGLGPARTVECVDVRTGKRAWGKANFYSGDGKGFASMIVAGDNILVLAETGELSLIGADPAECRVLAKTKVCGNNWCMPAYVEGMLFVRDDKELRCVGLTR